MGLASAVMLTVAVVATLLPARTAARADPTALLRAE
jgi:ABC-type lipoprotein release transport system permease subunit